MNTSTNFSTEVSSNSQNKTDESSELSQVANAFFVFALLVVLIGNLLGNSVVLYVVHHQWKNIKQRVTNSLITNLACIDLLVAILILLAIIKATIFRNSGITFAKCQLSGFLSTVSGSASLLTLAIIAIDRYIAIVLSSRRRLKFRTVQIIIACVWITAISFGFFPILFWGKYHYTEKSFVCKPKDGRFLLCLALVCFVVPLSTMVFCYVKVFLKVHRHKQMILQSQRDCRFSTEFKTTKIVFTVLAIFIVLWTPYTVVYVASSNSDKINTGTIPPSVFKFCGFLTALHSMCNPIIYFTMTKIFRKIAIKLLRKIFSCVLPANDESAATTESICCEKASCSAINRTPLGTEKVLPVQVLMNPEPGDSSI